MSPVYLIPPSAMIGTFFFFSGSGSIGYGR
jgi:hypothetical protein